jgi:hypothetical protein
MQRQDNIKLDLKEIPCEAVSWIQVAWDGITEHGQLLKEDYLIKLVSLTHLM